MSDALTGNGNRYPWLAVRIDHRFGNDDAGFRLSIAFQTSARRTVIFGPSGSGKSSVLRVIAGLLQPDAGRIEIQGRTVWKRSAASTRGVSCNVPVEQRSVGLVMQTPAVFPHLKVAENVAFALRRTDRPTREKKVRSLLETVDAIALADRWPRELSGGQLQRVAIARTLAAAPSVLLLDEPFSALDARSRQQLSENVHRWARDNAVPVLTVTHNLEEAFAAGDEVIAMQDGKIVAQGNASEVLAEERHRLLTCLAATEANHVPER